MTTWPSFAKLMSASLVHKTIEDHLCDLNSSWLPTGSNDPRPSHRNPVQGAASSNYLDQLDKASTWQFRRFCKKLA